MGEINEQCPSYDDGECVTYPAPYSVKCKDVKCRWQNIEEFNRVKDELFKKEERRNMIDEIEELLQNFVDAVRCESKECGCDDKEYCIECMINEIKDVLKEIDEYKKSFEYAQIKDVMKQNQSLQAELQPFRQPYFKDLSTAVIAELAKSQIKTTAQNINAEALIDYIEKTTVNAGTENAIRIIQQSIEKYRGKRA